MPWNANFNLRDIIAHSQLKIPKLDKVFPVLTHKQFISQARLSIWPIPESPQIKITVKYFHWMVRHNITMSMGHTFPQRIKIPID